MRTIVLATMVAAALPAVLGAQAPRVLRVEFVANEGVVVTAGPRRLIIDALYDAPNPAYAAPPPALLRRLVATGDVRAGDLVLVTHNHPDHFRAAVVDRFLAAHPRAAMIAPADVVAALRDSGAHWSSYADRVTPIALGVGDQATRTVAGVRVTAFRTLHSMGVASPMNLMYLVELDGWTVFHEGDANRDFGPFGAVARVDRAIDLALVHYWYPFVEDGRRALDSLLAARHVGLFHLPLEHDRFPAASFASLGTRFRLLDTPGEIWELRAAEP